jgi:hypothetical protein
MERPPCSSWSVWAGREIEGTQELGVPTLFIRRLDRSTAKSIKRLIVYKQLYPHLNRVWFCQEFWASGDCRVNSVIRKAFELYLSVCIETNAQKFPTLPDDIKEKARIYYKIPHQLKPGDQICVGPAYKDEAFEIGAGIKVAPGDYTQDVRLV